VSKVLSIVSSIMASNGSFTIEELQQIRSAVTFAAQSLQNRVKASVRVGSVVKWGSRDGSTMTGKVTRKGSKFIYCTTDRGNWKVSAELCTVV
jgi:hypothetical protein